MGDLKLLSYGEAQSMSSMVAEHGLLAKVETWKYTEVCIFQHLCYTLIKLMDCRTPV